VGSFCALCASERGPFVQRPLGRDDAMVAVCASCDGDMPAARPIERGYEPTGGLLSGAESTRGARKAMGERNYEKSAHLEMHAGLYNPPSPQGPDTAGVVHDARRSRRWKR
jgi:hypothetical protein